MMNVSCLCTDKLEPQDGNDGWLSVNVIFYMDYSDKLYKMALKGEAG